MKRTQLSKYDTFIEAVLAVLPKEIGTSDPMTWHTDLADWWSRHPDQLRSTIEAFIASMGPVEPTAPTDDNVAVALCCIPSWPLFDEILADHFKSRSLIQSALGDLEGALTLGRPTANMLASPPPLKRIIGWAKSGSLPLSMVAATLGRGRYLAENPIKMTLGEAKNCVTNCIRAGDISSAIRIFENSPTAIREELRSLLWRGLPLDWSGHDLPSLDPPSSWWDSTLKETKDRNPPQIVALLVEERPHLSQCLAGAMLRSGLHHVDNLARANPGLRSRREWPNRDGVPMVALGVVLDSWGHSMERRLPNSLDIDELRSKSDAVIRGLPDDVLSSGAHYNWTVILDGILKISHHGKELDDPPESTLAPTQPRSVVTKAILELTSSTYRKTAPSSLSRWSELSCFALLGEAQRSETGLGSFIPGSLDLVRAIFQERYLHGSQEDMLAAARAMDFVVNFPYGLAIQLHPRAPYRLEWDLWTLLVDRCIATSAGTKKKSLTAANGRIIRNISLISKQPELPTWPHSSACHMERVLSADDEMPQWLVALLQKEAMRTGVSFQNEWPDKKRGRL